MKHFTILFLLFISITAPAQEKAKNIILFIGDGMGTAHVYGAMVANKTTLNIEKFKFSGFSKTYSGSDLITDSGAGGTAIACGKKTYNGAIGVDMDTQNLKSILKIAKEQGKSVGIVSSCAFTHATPASFVANNASRKNDEAIALDFLKSDIDVVIAGGSDYLINRNDHLNLSDSLVKRGYGWYVSFEDCMKSDSRKIYCLSYTKHPPAIPQRGDYLENATAKAIEILSANPNGFFLMVEGSQIDWASHAKDGKKAIEEVIDLDHAVGKAMTFCEKEPSTLIILTADHETGGMTLVGGNRSAGTVKTKFTTNGHSAVMVPVFASGPSADLFSGIYENTAIFTKMLEALGISFDY